jgi:parvulin-like peptidyl-prolyl isomerase
MNQPVDMDFSLSEKLSAPMIVPASARLEQIKKGEISGEELISLLDSYRLMPKLMRELVIDSAIAAISYTDEEKSEACQNFYNQNKITSEEKQAEWLTQHQMSNAQVEDLVTRNLRIEKFKTATWSHQLESYFLQRKQQLDRVIYSLIRVKDLGLAQELFFRIQEGERSLQEMAREHSLGAESQTGGLVGPVELSVPHPALAQKLCTAKPGQLLPPSRLHDWIIIVRLEKFIPAELDLPMRQRLLNELFERWLQATLSEP